MQVVDVGQQIAGTRLKRSSVFCELHTPRRSVEQPHADIFFQPPDRC
jgi:hypothetical protein